MLTVSQCGHICTIPQPRWDPRSDLFTSRTIGRSAGLGPSALQALLAHGTARERRLYGVLTKYRIDLKVFRR